MPSGSARTSSGLRRSKNQLTLEFIRLHSATTSSSYGKRKLGTRDETQEKRRAKAHPSLLGTLITHATALVRREGDTHRCAGWALPTAAHHDRDSGQGKTPGTGPAWRQKSFQEFLPPSSPSSSKFRTASTPRSESSRRRSNWRSPRRDFRHLGDAEKVGPLLHFEDSKKCRISWQDRYGTPGALIRLELRHDDGNRSFDDRNFSFSPSACPRRLGP